MGDQRYADWDAAVDQVEPITFKFMGVEWTVPLVDFRDFAALNGKSEESAKSGGDDTAQCELMIDFLASICNDEKQFRLKADLHRPISYATLKAGVEWIALKSVGIPIEIKEGRDPLARSTGSSPASDPSTRSSRGNSRKSASKT